MLDRLRWMREKDYSVAPLVTASFDGSIANAPISAEMEVLGEKIEKLEAENQDLKRELKARRDDDG